MTKMAESLEAVYIYIYIVNFRESIIRKLNRINEKHRLFYSKIAYAFDTQ